MYAGRRWTIRQRGPSTAEASNAFFANHWPQAGRASRWHSISRLTAVMTRSPAGVRDVGKAGVAVDSVEDMKILFDGIPLDQVSAR